MPWALQRIQQAKCLHFVTFSCHHRDPLLFHPHSRDVLEQTLERVRQWYGSFVSGYVIMPEHVHLLVSEPERNTLARVLQMLKQNTAHLLRPPEGSPFWLPRYYDFNVWSEDKRVEKLRYMHRNPVRRGLVERPEDWPWSSFRHYASGVEGAVEIESQWTARKRELSGIECSITPQSQVPHPVAKKRDKGGAPPELKSFGEETNGGLQFFRFRDRNIPTISRRTHGNYQNAHRTAGPRLDRINGSACVRARRSRHL